jgi:hypothetical protein
MEELIQNFMLVTEGPQMPAGEVYFEAENPKGALGFYIVSRAAASLAPEDPRALVLQPLDPAQGVRRGHGVRRRLHPGLARLRDGRMRPMMNLKPETLAQIDEVIPHTR